MKKVWENPNLNKLGLKATEAVEPIILIQGVQGEIQILPMDPLRAWKCPCCHEQSDYIFENDEALKADFHSNHVPNCKKYDATTDSCIIS